MLRLAVLLATLTASACAQTAPTEAPAPPASADPVADRTEVEAAVQATIAQDGIHVVHFWAPWCGNSRAEFEGGLYEVVEAHPDVTFSFVTIWTDGRDGADRLARYGIEASDRVFVYGQPDRGPSADRDLRRRSFLGLPLSWTPTTWVFNRQGTLAYAFNYGEVSNEMLALAIEHARDEWMHE